MGSQDGKSFLPFVFGAIAAVGALFGLALWIATSDLGLAVRGGLVASLVTVGVPTFFVLPLALVVFGQFVAGRTLGLRLWYASIGPLTLTVGRRGGRWVSWRSSGRHVQCLMTAFGLARARRQMLWHLRGGVYGGAIAVVLYAWIGYEWSEIVNSPLAYLLVVLALIPAFPVVRTLSQEADRVAREHGYAAYAQACRRLIRMEHEGVRPCDWPEEDVRAVESREGSGMLYLVFAHANDAEDRARLEALVPRLEDLAESDRAAAETARCQLAYWSAQYLNDAEKALAWLDGDLGAPQALGWRGAAVLAVLVLLGRDDEAAALRDRVLAEVGDRDREYVEAHVARAMSLRRDG